MDTKESIEDKKSDAYANKRYESFDILYCFTNCISEHFKWICTIGKHSHRSSIPIFMPVPLFLRQFHDSHRVHGQM